MTTQTLNAHQKAIQGRLNELVTRHSQSGIARKTGAPRNKVNRYVHGARIPCEFAAALADGLGVNPHWFLTGEGGAEVGEVAPDTVRVADNLLELIRAMAAVEHMQLGALTGKHHLRVLRELSDAMRRYEKLRKQLNDRSTPVLRNVLADLRNAIDKRDTTRAGELCRTAEQLGRLCDDPSLALDLAALHARLALMDADLTGALDLARRVATLALHSGGNLGRAELEAMAGTVEALVRLGRVEEARRIAEASLVLATDETRSSDEALALTAELAFIQMHTGELRPGLQTVTGLSGKLAGGRGAHVDAIFTRGLLFSGAIDVRAAIAFKGDSVDKAIIILAFALFTEDKDALTHSLAHWERTYQTRYADSVDGGPRWRARMVLGALRGESTIVPGVRAVLDAKAQGHEMLLDWRSIIGAQIFRLLGNTTEAARYFRKADRNIAGLPAWFNMGVIWEARHMRNALALGNRTQVRNARDFFRCHIDLGYGCFANLV
jgi:tetratricopeptide (TPR) repeat protein